MKQWRDKNPQNIHYYIELILSDEITIETETIDASALEDKIERTIAGRGSTGGTFGVTVNVTD